VNEKFVFIIFVFKNIQHLCVVRLKCGHLNDTPNENNELF